MSKCMLLCGRGYNLAEDWQAQITHRSNEGSTIGPSVEQLQVLVWEGVGFEIESQNKLSHYSGESPSAFLSQFLFPIPLSKKHSNLWFPSVFSNFFLHFVSFRFSFLHLFLIFSKIWNHFPLFSITQSLASLPTYRHTNTYTCTVQEVDTQRKQRNWFYPESSSHDNYCSLELWGRRVWSLTDKSKGRKILKTLFTNNGLLWIYWYLFLFGLIWKLIQNSLVGK